jgi:hypothetical protein
LHILNLNTLIYLHEPRDLAKSNLVIHFPAILSRLPLAEADLVIHLPAILSRMPLAEANLVNTLDFIHIEYDIYCNCIQQKNFKLYKCKRRENHAPALFVWRPPLIEDPILVAPPESQGSFWLWFLQADIIKNPYSYITHMLLSMHVHFLIITYIHISCIFSELVSQCASVLMTQFFYILTYSIHVKVYCYCLTLNCYCLIVTIQLLLYNFYCLDIELLLSNWYCLDIELLLSEHLSDF